MRKISIRVGDATGRLLTEATKQERREEARVVAAALRWCLRLPPGARDAIRRLETAGEEAVHQGVRAAERALLGR
jgi:hypothetical protein